MRRTIAAQVPHSEKFSLPCFQTCSTWSTFQGNVGLHYLEKYSLPCLSILSRYSVFAYSLQCLCILNALPLHTLYCAFPY
jgi:hypothetical protein